MCILGAQIIKFHKMMKIMDTEVDSSVMLLIEDI